MKLVVFVGVRPNFMKLAPIYSELQDEHGIIIAHTGQHYDKNMNEIFFEEFGLPEPQYIMGVGGKNSGEMIGEQMKFTEEILNKEKPDATISMGDANPILSSAIIAAHKKIPIIRVEAGYRAFDRRMPEEINRIIADHTANLLFANTENAVRNLQNEGVDSEKIKHVGNVMIDTLNRFLPRVEESKVLDELGMGEKEYALFTAHRKENTEEKTTQRLVEIINTVAEKIKLVWPIHPRTKNALMRYGLTNKINWENIVKIPPIGYFDFVNLEMNAKVVFTDSGGVQEETSILGTPCLTLRYNTERPITVQLGTNELVGLEKQLVEQNLEKILNGNWKDGKEIPLWDGNAAKRIKQELGKWEPKIEYLDMINNTKRFESE